MLSFYKSISSQLLRSPNHSQALRLSTIWWTNASSWGWLSPDLPLCGDQNWIQRETRQQRSLWNMLQIKHYSVLQNSSSNIVSVTIMTNGNWHSLWQKVELGTMFVDRASDLSWQSASNDLYRLLTRDFKPSIIIRALDFSREFNPLEEDWAISQCLNTGC